MPPLYAVPACRDVLQYCVNRDSWRLLRRVATANHSFPLRIAWVWCLRSPTPRIGRGKPRPKTAAASRRTPHSSRRRGREVDGCDFAKVACRARRAVPLRIQRRTTEIPRSSAAADSLGSGVWTPVQFTGLPKPEMTILVGSSIPSADYGERIGLGPGRELRQREPRAGGVGAELIRDALGEHVGELLHVARGGRGERPGAERGRDDVSRRKRGERERCPRLARRR